MADGILRIVSKLTGVAAFKGQGGFGRATTVCWALAQIGLQQGCRDLARLYPPIRVAPWFVAEAAAAEGDDLIPPETTQAFLTRGEASRR